MNNEEIIKSIKQLKIQNILFLIFALLSLMNIRGDKFEEEYLLSNNKKSKVNANKTFTLTIKIALLIYIYFLIRNYEAYKNIEEEKKNLYLIKVYGSCLFLAGSICLLYFQNNQNTFLGGPAI